MKKASRVALTCDAWTSVATKSFVTITVHFVLESDKNEWKLASHVLQTREMSESHNGANVAKLLEKAAAEWQISEKDLVLVTDNASNMVVAAQKANFLPTEMLCSHCQLGLTESSQAGSCGKAPGEDQVDLYIFPPQYHRTPPARGEPKAAWSQTAQTEDGRMH